MMFFDSENPRKFLEENRFVCTFRTFNYNKKPTRYLAKLHDEKNVSIVFADILVCNLKDVYSCEDIEPFAEFSGFKDSDEWVAEIRKLDNIRLPLRGGFKKLGNLCFVVKI